MKSTTHFADEKLKRSYEELKDSKTEDKNLYKWISKAIDDIEENAFCGIQIPKKLIPKVYIKKYSIDNLWKYDLPRGWRLIYSVAGNKILIVSIIIEWITHKEYERRFKY
ncbi:MAG: type II toxin-antitoxin system YoeB family toxin [Nanoarchaeota archaeon]|nr:type II toxin-antitoxin system YoeB family toxin [Nanoarchaeota archaeon]